MKQNVKKSGRPPKAEPTTFRCSVNFTAAEEAKLMSMHEQSGIQSLSAFIKMQLFGKTFKIHYIDDNTRIFIDKLSSLQAHYRTISIEYSNLIHLLRLNFTEKKSDVRSLQTRKNHHRPRQAEPRDCSTIQTIRYPLERKITINAISAHEYAQ